MAKKSKGVGQLITIRRMNGVGSLNKPGTLAGSVLPPVLGAGVAIGAMLAARYLAKPSEGETPRTIFKFAPLLGMGAGLLTSVGLYWLGGAPAMLSSGAAAIVAGGGAFASDMLLKTRLGEYQMAVADDAVAATQGLGVLVPERIGTQGTGALMFEDPRSRDPVNRYGVGAYGENVRISGISPSSFGRSHIS